MTRSSGAVADIAKVLGQARWRILGELCRHGQTASALATTVKTSANAVRVHLDALEDAGLVEYVVERGRPGKPTHVYSLTAAGEFLLSRAYGPALHAILQAAKQRLNGGMPGVLRDAGRALAREAHDDAPRKGLEAARTLLENLGSPAQVERTDGRTVLVANCCPLGGVTRRMPELCAMLESAISEASGRVAREQCVRGDHPQCRFELGA